MFRVQKLYLTKLLNIDSLLTNYFNAKVLKFNITFTLNEFIALVQHTGDKLALIKFNKNQILSAIDVSNVPFIQEKETSIHILSSGFIISSYIPFLSLVEDHSTNPNKLANILNFNDSAIQTAALSTGYGVHEIKTALNEIWISYTDVGVTGDNPFKSKVITVNLDGDIINIFSNHKPESNETKPLGDLFYSYAMNHDPLTNSIWVYYYKAPGQSTYHSKFITLTFQDYMMENIMFGVGLGNEKDLASFL